MDELDSDYLLSAGADLEISADRVRSLIPGCIPDSHLLAGERSLDRWTHLITQAYRKSYYLRERE